MFQLSAIEEERDVMRAVGDNGEFDLRGTAEEFAELRERLWEFCCDDGAESFVVDLESGFDPAPYRMVFRSTVFVKSAGKLVIRAEGDELIVTGHREGLLAFADWLPKEVDEAPYHVHFDGVSLPDLFAREDQGIVFSVYV
ncbi:MAG: hypothetical protein CMO55_14715 [Verrucomicrobiales bacterium]|nr:hypothetical protein [Verrucomicrobiales bacterium]